MFFSQQHCDSGLVTSVNLAITAIWSAGRWRLNAPEAADLNYEADCFLKMFPDWGRSFGWLQNTCRAKWHHWLMSRLWYVDPHCVYKTENIDEMRDISQCKIFNVVVDDVILHWLLSRTSIAQWCKARLCYTKSVYLSVSPSATRHN